MTDQKTVSPFETKCESKRGKTKRKTTHNSNINSRFFSYFFTNENPKHFFLFLLQYQLIIQKFTYHNFESCATKKNSIDLFHWEQSTNCSHTPNSIHQKAKQSVPCRAIEATNEKKRKTDWQCTHKTDTTDVFHSKFKERIARKTATQDV